MKLLCLKFFVFALEDVKLLCDWLTIIVDITFFGTLFYMYSRAGKKRLSRSPRYSLLIQRLCLCFANRQYREKKLLLPRMTWRRGFFKIFCILYVVVEWQGQYFTYARHNRVEASIVCFYYNMNEAVKSQVWHEHWYVVISLISIILVIDCT